MHTAAARVTAPPPWFRWLVTAALIVIAFGASMVLAPNATRRLFGLLLFASPDGVDALAGPAIAYVSLVHAVLGATMVGWGVLLLLVVLGPFRRGSGEAWCMLAASLAAWFVPDTAYSLLFGFWPNAVLNAGFLALFAVPLAATWRAQGGGSLVRAPTSGPRATP